MHGGHRRTHSRTESARRADQVNRASLLTAIFENPEDDTPRLVLADFLRESENRDEHTYGQFLWACVTVAYFRGQVAIDDPLYRSAMQEMLSVASQGYPALWMSSLGLGPAPLTINDWTWDNDFGRATVRIGAVTGVFTRGMLSELSVTLGDWYSVGAAALAKWPLQLATINDIPGLSFSIEPVTGEWVLTARLQLRGWQVRQRGREAVFPYAVTVDGPESWQAKRTIPNRELLMTGLAATCAQLVHELGVVAGDRWPSAPRRRV